MLHHCDNDSLQIGDLVIKKNEHLKKTKKKIEKIGLITKIIFVEWAKEPKWYLVHWVLFDNTKWHAKEELININKL